MSDASEDGGPDPLQLDSLDPESLRIALLNVEKVGLLLAAYRFKLSLLTFLLTRLTSGHPRASARDQAHPSIPRSNAR